MDGEPRRHTGQSFSPRSGFGGSAVGTVSEPGTALLCPQVPQARTQFFYPCPWSTSSLFDIRFLGRLPILGMGVLPNEKPSPWFTFLGVCV